MQDRILSLLNTVYGYKDFRGKQREIIESLIAGDDALVLMPTGGGKSLCYQIPSILRPGVGLVVSPLISLMQNQVQALQELGVKAAYLNSTLSAEESSAVYSSLYRGELDLLYAAPERVLMDSFLEMLSNLELSLIAIDEAHCVSQWGHDFRPEYAELKILHDRFPNVPRVALTATADTPTQSDIKRLLELENAKDFIHGFDRPNINYRVSVKKNAKTQLIHFLKDEHPTDAGIVYCLSRKKTEEIAAFLCDEGFRAYPYHAGLDSKIRERHQDIFIKEEGVIIVATIAFGMGIDKPNVRFVAHLSLPKSIESYYQETGRAGRDGLPATAWMVYGLGDIATLYQMIKSSDTPDDKKRIDSHKVASLVGFAETAECRRKVLLNYFGESHSGQCDECSNCLEPPKCWDGTEASQKALSAVYRTGQRFGASHLCDVLVGKDTVKIKQFRHDQLSVYGVGKDFSTVQWGSVFRQLVAAGYLNVDVVGYGGLELTPSAKELFGGQKTIMFREDIFLNTKRAKQRKTGSSKHSTAEIVLSEGENQIFELLRQKRLELAKEKKIAPYMIFHDKTLVEIASRLPKTRDELSMINGVGEVKLDQYGNIFLDVLKDCAAYEG